MAVAATVSAVLWATRDGAPAASETVACATHEASQERSDGPVSSHEMPADPFDFGPDPIPVGVGIRFETPEDYQALQRLFEGMGFSFTGEDFVYNGVAAILPPAGTDLTRLRDQVLATGLVAEAHIDYLYPQALADASGCSPGQ